MLRPFEKEGTRYACAHWKIWPPVQSVHGQTGDRLRAVGALNDADYQRYQVWERKCGLQAMDPAKCLTCPLVRTLEVREHVPVLVDPDNNAVPAVDIQSMSLVPRHRENLVEQIRKPGSRHSGKTADWIKVSQDQQKGEDG